MTPSWKLLFAMVGLSALGFGSHEAVVRLRPPPASMQERGLAWLKEEFHLSEENFRRIAELHRDYFQKCDQMCEEMMGTARLRGLRESPELRRSKKAFCDRCMSTMVSHLEGVAALMPPEEGRRFLQEILPELTHPRELEEMEAEESSPP